MHPKSVVDFSHGYDVLASKTGRFLTHVDSIEDVVRYAIGGNYTPREIEVYEDGNESRIELSWTVKVEVYETKKVLQDVVEF